MKKITFCLGVVGCLTLGAGPAFGDGKALYDQHCKKCHGEKGEGNEKIAKMMKVENEKLVLQKAFKAEDVIASIKTGKDKMKPVTALTDDAAIRAVVDHVATLATQK